jgi:hypothetical protein
MRDIGGMIDDIIPLMCSPPLTSDEKMMDLMLIEALLIGQRPETKGGTSTSSCAASGQPSVEEIHYAMLLRSEADVTPQPLRVWR